MAIRGAVTRKPAQALLSSRPGSPNVRPMVLHGGLQMTSARSVAANSLTRGQSLVFQLEVDSKELPKPSPLPQRAQRNVHAVLDHMDRLLVHETSFEARLARDARYYHGTIIEEDGRVDAVVLGSSLAGVGHTVTIRTAIGGGSGISAFKHLSHEFVVVAGPGPDGHRYKDCVEYIVDPHFREQFNIPQAISWYDEILHSIPEVYVGVATRLRPLVRLLGIEMAAAFEAAGAVTPPWRTPASLLSKWLPKVSRDRSSSTDSCKPIPSSYPSSSANTVPAPSSRSSLRSDSIPVISRRDFRVQDDKGSTAQQMQPQGGEMRSSQRFGSRRFDPSVPMRHDCQQSASGKGSAKESSMQRALVSPTLKDGQLKLHCQNAGVISSSFQLSVPREVADSTTASIMAASASGSSGTDNSISRQHSHLDPASLWEHSLAHAAHGNIEAGDASLKENLDMLSGGLALDHMPASSTVASAPMASDEASSSDQATQLSSNMLSQERSATAVDAMPVQPSPKVYKESTVYALPQSMDAQQPTLPKQLQPAAGHPQLPAPPLCRPDQAADVSDKAPNTAPPQQHPNTPASALSTKLARMQLSALPTKPTTAIASTLRSASAMRLSQAACTPQRRPQQQQQQQQQRVSQHSQRQPSLDTPFWNEPLVKAYIAKQQPNNVAYLRRHGKRSEDQSRLASGNSVSAYHDSSKAMPAGPPREPFIYDKRQATSQHSTKASDRDSDVGGTSSQPRIRKVKMRGISTTVPLRAAAH